jgi:predicted transport protein
MLDNIHSLSYNTIIKIKKPEGEEDIMSKIKFSELTEGSVILRPKNGAQFKVISILADEKKADLKSVEGDELITLSAATIERWYTKAEESEEKKPALAVARPVRRGRVAPKPKKEVIEETIPEVKEQPEEVGSISEKASVRKPAPKKESVMAITKTLENRIVEAFPASTRIVTQSYVAYRSKKNFVTIEETRKGVSIGVRAKGLTEDQKKLLASIAPASYEWAIDGIFKIVKEADIDTAMELIEASHLSSL